MIIGVRSDSMCLFVVQLINGSLGPSSYNRKRTDWNFSTSY